MQEIGIIVAVDEEREAILNIMTDVKVEQIYNLRVELEKLMQQELHK